MPLSQRQIKAIFAQNRSRGLRSTIRALRQRGHKASDWQTLFHGTERKHVPSILRKGFRTWQASDYEKSGVWFGRRGYANNYGDALLKVRLPKKKLEYLPIENFDMLSDDSSLEHEWLSRRNVPKSNIRSVSLYRLRGPKRGRYNLSEEAVKRIQRRKVPDA